MPKDSETAESSAASTLDAETPELENEQEVQEAFDRVFGDGDKPTPRRSAEDYDDPESTASLERAAEEEVDPSLQTRKTEDEDERDEDEETPEGADDGSVTGEDGDAPTLDPTLRHAARRAGWSDAEIDELAAAKPDLAERTFQRLHGSYSDLSARYAKLGKTGGSEQQGGSETPAAPTGESQEQQGTGNAQQQQSDSVQTIFGDEAKKLSDKYGEDFMGDVVKPMADHLMGLIQPVHQDYQARQQEQVGEQVNRFFDGLPETHQQLYGAKQKVDGDQSTKRQEVAQLADQILAGAELQDVPMSIDEALDRAVTLHAKDHLSNLERKRITSQVKKRSTQMTARPSNRNRQRPGGEAKAQEAVAAKMAELGVDQN